MLATTLRDRRWPLALTLAILGACADEPSAPSFSLPTSPNADVADPYLVTNTNDTGIGSLRWALSFTTGGETIRFDPSIAGQTIALDSSLYIRKSVTIDGPASAGITVSGRGTWRVFDTGFTGTLTVRNLAVTGGYSPLVLGAAFGPDANLVLENTVVYGNQGMSGSIVAGRKVTLTNSTVTGNSALSTPPEVWGAVTGDTLELINSTVAHNGYGGVGKQAGRVTLRNSIISNNAALNCANVGGSLVREGSNMSDDDSCGGPTEILIGDPVLQPLADNGGPTRTHALLAGSPAINRGTSCTVTVDQRYAARDTQCDLGAYESTDFTTVKIAIDPTSIIKQATGTALMSGTITCSRAESFKLVLDLKQEQKAGKTSTEVHASSTVPVECSTVARTFSASMTLTEGVFQNGSANAEVHMLDAEPWITPTSASGAVRLFRSR